MKIGRFLWEEKEFLGIVKEREVTLLTDKGAEKRVELSQVKILPPCLPTKIVGVGLNYRDHAEELGMPLPEEPLIFLKPSTAVIGHEEYILLPPESEEVHYEGELAIVMGTELYRPASLEEAKRAILGYTCFNDVTARDLQRKDGQWTRAKSFNTFAPLGPFIVLDLDTSNLAIQTRVNGQTVQRSNTALMIFKPLELVYKIAQVMTLKPGDVIATGTPPGVGPLKPGDIVEVEIENIGILKNYVKSLQER